MQRDVVNMSERRDEVSTNELRHGQSTEMQTRMSDGERE